MNEFYSVELLSVVKQKMLVHLQRISISAATVCLRCQIKLALCGPALYFTASALSFSGREQVVLQPILNKVITKVRKLN